MLGFNSLANITLYHILCNFTLQTRPPIELLERRTARTKDVAFNARDEGM